uniref:FERM domain-containing protein n=1 Tax=Heterorhabditis bacteriophora TaxID=37862 RepID=A0A1I7XLE4_HETBA
MDSSCSTPSSSRSRVAVTSRLPHHLQQPSSSSAGGDQPRHEYFFLDPAQKIVKYAPKQPRFSNWHNRSTENRPLLVLYFRVRVYIDQVRLITCPKALEHYYLQLKDNYLDQWSGGNSVSEERCWEMAALALKVDKGDGVDGYFRAEQYFPIWVIEVRGLGYVQKYMPAASEDLKDMSRFDAMTKFALEASRFPFALNCHLYGLRRHKMDSVDNAVLGINAKGIEMCDIGKEGERIPLRALPWNRVTRLSFDRKKLTIVGADGTKMSLYAQNESKARYLLELCRAVHQTLLVLSHQNGKIAPLPQPFQEKSVDRLSTSSNATSGIVSGDHERDSDSLLHDSLNSVCDRGQGSVSSKQRVRIKLDSNLDLKIEKMELEHIRQERAASQSSKASEMSDKTERKESTVVGEIDIAHEELTSDPTLSTAIDLTNVRPSSVDSASQTVESGNRSAPVDVNFNCKTTINAADLVMFETFGAFGMNNVQFPNDLQYASSGDSRSDSVQQSNEMLPEVMMHSYHQDQTCVQPEDENLALRSSLPQQASISLHDLRTAGIKQPPRYNEALMDSDMHRAMSPRSKPRWTTVTGMSPTDHSQMIGLAASGQARSEPKIDSDLWSHPSVSAALLDSPSSSNNGRLFTKRAISGAINRVHSMPAHYHVINGYQRNSPIDDYSHPSLLQHAQSMNASRPKTRDPPPYERALEIQRGSTVGQAVTLPSCIHQLQQNGHSLSSNGPLPAEAAGGQAAFPPASVTPMQFATHDGKYFMDEEGISTERLRDFPMIHRLWRESNGLLTHQRRPSSCIDLTSDFSSHVPPVITTVNLHPTACTHRGDYYLDSALQNYAPYVRPTVANTNSYAWRPSTTPAVMDLPPPPPYPAGRKAPMVM